MLLNLKFPLNVELFFSTIFPFITFDMINTTWLYGKLFGNIDDSAFSLAWTTFGYGAHLVINNIGSVMLFIWLQPLLLLFTFVARKYLKSQRYKSRVQSRLEKLFGSWVETKYRELRYNGLISFYTENYLFLSMLGWLSISTNH